MTSPAFHAAAREARAWRGPLILAAIYAAMAAIPFIIIKVLHIQ
jgi:hypothetical protein